MAVQAQFLNRSIRRIDGSVPLHEFESHFLLNPYYPLGAEVDVDNGKGRKRLRESEPLVDPYSLAGGHMYLQQQPTGIPSTSGRDSTFLTEELQAHVTKQQEEIEQVIKMQGECLRQALEEKRQKHTRSLLASIEQGIVAALKEREFEIQRVSNRNLMLEERVKQLVLESQLWQNMAKNNEIMASNLRTSLEQVVANNNHNNNTNVHSRGGGEQTGESDADDAESCHVGSTAGEAHAHVFSDTSSSRRVETRACRLCRHDDVCVLLLPCRHLCLCKKCEAHVDSCPICKTPKNASVRVHMS